MTAVKFTQIAMRSACLSLGLAASIVTAQTGPVEPVRSFWTDWVALWNGDLGLADEVIAQRVVLHTTLLDGRDPAAIDDPQAFAQWVGSLREAIPDLSFETVAGPISEITGPDSESIVAGHWRATGTYQGGFPGASAVAGTPVEFTGTDMVRVKERCRRRILAGVGYSNASFATRRGKLSMAYPQTPQKKEFSQ